jgi:hypothetical protein
VKRLRYVLLGVVSFFAVSSLVGIVLWQAMGLNEHDPFTQKIASAEEKMPVDALFIGASYIEGGIDPSIFDKEMAAHGHPFKSYNLGVGTLSVVEMNEAVKEVLARRNCCRYVLLSPSFHLWGLVASSDNVRSILFMTLPHAIEELAYVLSAPHVPNSPITRPEYVRNIITATFRHYTNLGLAANLLGLTTFSEASGNLKRNPTWNSEGYTRWPDHYNAAGDTASYQAGLLSVLDERPRYLAQAATDAQHFADRQVSPEMVERFVRIAEQAEAAGAIPLVLLPPIVGDWTSEADFSVKFAQRCGSSHVLDFDDPSAFPAIFDVSVRYDGGHLNSRGAPVWSRLVARRMAAMLDNGELRGPFCKRP